MIARADAVLAIAFGLTAKEADQVLNYDTKYRMMLGANDADPDD